MNDLISKRQVSNLNIGDGSDNEYGFSFQMGYAKAIEDVNNLPSIPEYEKESEYFTTNFMEGWDGDEGSTFMCEQCGLNIDDWKTSDCKGRLNGKYYKFKYCPECGRKIVFTLEKNAKYMQ